MMEIYLAEPETRNLPQVLKQMARGLCRGSYFGFRLCVKNIRSDYAKSKFGPLWDFVEPLAIALVFILLRRSQVLDIQGMDIPYAVFVTVGTLLWQTFVDAITLPLGVLSRSKAMLINSRVFPESIMLSVIFQVIFNSFFRIMVIVLVVVYFNLLSWAGLIKFLLAFPLIILAGYSIGLFLSPFSVIYGDISKLTHIILRPMMFVSAVVFPLPETGILSYFNNINPVAVFITNLRSLLLGNNLEPILPLIIYVSIFTFLMAVGWLVFHISVKIVAERI
jgi:lipopolysaccharide transport system permease protein